MVAISCHTLAFVSLAFVEVLAVLQAILWAFHISFRHLIVEGNNQKLMSTLSKGCASDDLEWGSIVPDCLSTEALFHSISFVHVKREANEVAHRLTKHVLTVKDEEI